MCKFADKKHAQEYKQNNENQKSKTIAPTDGEQQQPLTRFFGLWIWTSVGFGLRIWTFGLPIWTLVRIEKSKLDLVQFGLESKSRSPGRDFLDLSPSPN